LICPQGQPTTDRQRDKRRQQETQWSIVRGGTNECRAEGSKGSEDKQEPRSRYAEAKEACCR